MNLGERMRRARETMGWKLADLSKRSGVAYATIQILESRNSERSKYIEELVRAFPHEKVSHQWLRSGNGQMHPVMNLMTLADNQPETDEPDFEEAGIVQVSRRVPVVGTAKMDGDYYEETMLGGGDGALDIQTKARHAYALKVRGDSMSPAIRDGWFVLIEPEAEPAVGEYVLIKLKSGKKMVKELLYQRSDSITVTSVNGGSHQTILREDMDRQRGLQAVSAVVSPSKWRPDPVRSRAPGGAAGAQPTMATPHADYSSAYPLQEPGK